MIVLTIIKSTVSDKILEHIATIEDSTVIMLILQIYFGQDDPLKKRFVIHDRDNENKRSRKGL